MEPGLMPADIIDANLIPEGARATTIVRKADTMLEIFYAHSLWALSGARIKPGKI